MDKDEISTRLRIPGHLHTRLSRLAKSNERSLHSYMLMILKDHVIDFENVLVEKLGAKKFEEIYYRIFPSDCEPLIYDERFEIRLTQRGEKDWESRHNKKEPPTEIGDGSLEF